MSIDPTARGMAASVRTLLLPASPDLATADGIEAAVDMDFVGGVHWAGSRQDGFLALAAALGGTYRRALAKRVIGPGGAFRTVPANMPALAYDPVSGDPAGLLVERDVGEVINIASGSGGPGWSEPGVGTTNATIGPSNVLGPDGLLCRLVTSTAANGYAQSVNVALPGDNSPYLVTAPVPKTESSQIVSFEVVLTVGSGAIHYVRFDTSNGVIGIPNGGVTPAFNAPAGQYGVIDCGTYWLPWLAVASGSNAVLLVRFHPFFNGTGAALIGSLSVLKGALAMGSRPDGLLGAHRARDFVELPADAVFGSAAAGTLTVTAMPPGGALDRVIAQLDDGSESNRITVRRSAAGTIEAVVVKEGTILRTAALGAHTAYAETSVSIGWDAAGVQVCRNGAGRLDLAAAPPTISKLRLGGNSLDASLDGVVRRVSAWAGRRTSPFQEAPTGTILALGDSMAAGSGTSSPPDDTWRYLLSNGLGRNRSFAAYPGEDTTYILTQWLAFTANRADVAIIWCGHNNADTARDVANIAAMLDHMSTEPAKRRFLVLSPLQNAASAVGSAAYNTILATRTALKAAYGAHYVDVFAELATRGNGSPQDNADIANGRTPTSLRADDIHINATAQGHVAELLRRKLLAMGY